MNVADFDYDLPPDRIAQHPLPRGASKLLILARDGGAVEHETFAAIVPRFRAGDVLVVNDTKVMPARLRGRRAGGGELEVLLLRRDPDDLDAEVWTCLARPGRRLRIGESAELCGGIAATWLDEPDDIGIRRVRLRASRPIVEILDEAGEVPLPPYIARGTDASDREAYQTVYAASPGAVAAPTAGLHFTPELLGEIRGRGVEIVPLTLHVGPGTFLPLRSDMVEDHRMTSEWIEIPTSSAERIAAAKHSRRRVVAVGTTTVRALEGAADDVLEGRGTARDVSLFIVPGHRFRVVDGLITNFHLPRSTLLMLVAAFAGRERILAAYREAVDRGYRFYSYGDAMMIA